jgi:hypothetical protein
MGKLRSMDSNALREMTITRTVLSDLHVKEHIAFERWQGREAAVAVRLW